MRSNSFYSIFFLLLLFCGSISISTSAQSDGGKTWTIQECFDHAKDNNLQLKQLQVGERIAEENLRTSEAARNPNVNGSASYGVSVGRNIDPVTNSFSTSTIQSFQPSINSVFLIYGGGQVKNNIALSESQLELSRLQSDEALYNIELSILTAYMNVLLAEEQATVVAEQAQLTSERLARSEKMVKAGSIPKGDLKSIEAQMATDRMNAVSAENAIANAYLFLQQLLDLYEPMQLTTPNVNEVPLSLIEQMNVEEVFQNALAYQPSFKTAAMNDRIAEQRLLIAESGKLPSLSLITNINSRWSSLGRQIDEDADPIEQIVDVEIPSLGTVSIPFGTVPAFERAPFVPQLGDNFGGYMGLNLQVPIYNNRRVKSQVNLAQLDIENRRLMKTDTERQLRRDIEQAFLNAKAAAERYKSGLANIEALRQAMEFTEKRMEVGSGSNYEYFIAQNNLTTAELNQRSAKYEYLFRLKILDFYQGKSISF